VGRRIVDVSLDNLPDAPDEVRGSLYWELEADDPSVDPAFEKEEWFSEVLLEWGTCGKLAVDDDRGAVGFAEYAPSSFFPRLGSFRCGTISPDAVYLSYCYVVAPRRGFGLGTELVRTVARDLVDRGYHALEAVGDREAAEGWVLPAPFLAVNGFRVILEDRRFPLMRLDLRTAVEPEPARAGAAVPLPAPGLA
jgi:GNAT superfamily N-acetyltransferase